MTPKDGFSNQLLRDLAERAKKARKEGKTPDNKAALRAHDEQLIGCYFFLAVALIIIALMFFLSLLS